MHDSELMREIHPDNIDKSDNEYIFHYYDKIINKKGIRK